MTLNINERRVILAHIWVAVGALFVGTSFGLMQVYTRAGATQASALFDYYRLLTAHGVLLAIVFTTFFICAIATYATFSTIPRQNRPLGFAWAAWWVMLIGTVMAAVEILAGNASVLYTFYAPLKASPWFYLGATLLVAGSWVVMVDVLVQIQAFKAANPGRKVPLPAFVAAVTFVMWFIATLGVAGEMLLLIPWAFGWVPGVDVHLSRIMFWYFGHPLVYFWIMGAYMVWYTVIPRILKVPVWSDSLTRLAFLLLLLLSLPVGLHHQFMDPGISNTWKLLHTFLTLCVVLPSLMTAFAIFATFEAYAAKQGKRGFAAIVGSLPWENPAFTGSTLAMILFIFGGFGGIVNSSYSLDILVHNTMWVVGHFHITVGGPVALTFLAVSYLMIPALTGRQLMTPRLANAQVIGYFVGMSIMSIGMHVEGLLGAPRRTANLDYGNSIVSASWGSWSILAAIGGTIIFANIILYAFALAGLIGVKAKGETDFAFAEAEDKESSPWWLNRLDLWVAAALVLMIAAYTGPVVQHFTEGTIYLAPGARTW
ncbi:MAG: cbb3-type cytochrome c oxidase subunit I [Candidatus Eremiobacteraeota bacterium]|nr:cbb3-type cytochrome c oxidase subunit I [Candidatus Eremiobacteraeota bacterium]